MPTPFKDHTPNFRRLRRIFYATLVAFGAEIFYAPNQILHSLTYFPTIPKENGHKDREWVAHIFRKSKKFSHPLSSAFNTENFYAPFFKGPTPKFRPFLRIYLCPTPTPPSAPKIVCAPKILHPSRSLWAFPNCLEFLFVGVDYAPGFLRRGTILPPPRGTHFLVKIFAKMPEKPKIFACGAFILLLY